MAARVEIEEQLGMHLLRIVNMWRNGMNDDEVRVTALFCGLPEWAILRIGRDMHKLTSEQQKRYDSIIQTLDERDANA